MYFVQFKVQGKISLDKPVVFGKIAFLELILFKPNIFLLFCIRDNHVELFWLMAINVQI